MLRVWRSVSDSAYLQAFESSTFSRRGPVTVPMASLKAASRLMAISEPMPKIAMTATKASIRRAPTEFRTFMVH